MIEAIAILSALCAALYGAWLVHRDPGPLRSVVKTVPVAALALISALSGGPVALSLALALGAVGDFCLSRPGQKAFLAGLSAFLVGHLFYAILLLRLGGGIVALAEPWRVAALLALVLFAGGLLRWLIPYLGALVLPILLYGTAILAMGGAALTLPIGPSLGWAIVGAGMFIASDAILAVQLFVMDPQARGRRAASLLLWFLYWGGQAVIAAAVLRAIG